MEAGMNLDLRFYQELEAQLLETIERHAAEIIHGRAIDFADYRGRVQYLKALRDALEAARDVQARVLGIEDRER